MQIYSILKTVRKDGLFPEQIICTVVIIMGVATRPDLSQLTDWQGGGGRGADGMRKMPQVMGTYSVEFETQSSPRIGPLRTGNEMPKAGMLIGFPE